MDFELSPVAAETLERLTAFVMQEVIPAEEVYEQQLADGGDPHRSPPVMEDLKDSARDKGIWNLFLPRKTRWSEGLSNLDYAPLAEVMGTSHLAPEACNCSAPDTGNMEILAEFGTQEQQERWLRPLLEGEIRSAFSMTEPAVASSDATNVACRIEPAGDDYVINGHKWFSSGASDPRCEVLVLMGKTDPSADVHQQQSMVLVPTRTPGLRHVRSTRVFGYESQPGHAELTFQDVRVPRTNLLGQEGGGFAIAQARLGPGRIHHCMRLIGMAERALTMMIDRVEQRVTFGKPLAEQGVIQEWIADSRMEIDQARLYTLYTAWLMDTAGNKVARGQIAGIKVAVPRMATRVVDRAIQAHGAMGVTEDTPLARMYAGARSLRIADGPDEVHRRTVARQELRSRRQKVQA